MKSVTLTERSNGTANPRIGDYVIANFNHGKVEGYIISTKWVNETKHLQYTLLEVFNPLTQAYNKVRHTTSMWSYDPFVEHNWFF